jgi:hypothetical protein
MNSSEKRDNAADIEPRPPESTSPTASAPGYSLWQMILLALVTVALIWRFKKLPEPVIVLAAALIGLVVYPLMKS